MTFEGIVGSSYKGDLAIDDVSISSGSCFGQTAAPPVFSTVSTQATSSPDPTEPPTLSTATTHTSSSSSAGIGYLPLSSFKQSGEDLFAHLHSCLFA